MTNFTIGSHCAIVLPNNYLNIQKTPAKGLVANILLDNSHLILIEEVWQARHTTRTSVSVREELEKPTLGWYEVPWLIKSGCILMPAKENDLFFPSKNTLDRLIKEALEDIARIANNCM